MPIQQLIIKGKRTPPPPPPKTKREKRKEFWLKERWAIIGAIILLIAIAGIVYFIFSVMSDFGAEGSNVLLLNAVP